MTNISQGLSQTNTQQNAILAKQVSYAGFGAIIACVLFSIPLWLIYLFCFHKKTYWFRSFILFTFVYLLGSVVALMFYRVSVMNDTAIQINKMGLNDVGFVMATTLGGFMVVVITLMGVSANPYLIDIFENTLGFMFIQFFGTKDLTDEIFSSKTMDGIKKNAKDYEFDYSFLLTRFNLDNLEELIQYGRACNKENRDRSYLLGLDFDFILEFDEQEERLRNMVHMKNTVGHFVWIYLASIVALFVSMVAIAM
jgi:hypothetical protein